MQLLNFLFKRAQICLILYVLGQYHISTISVSFGSISHKKVIVSSIAPRFEIISKSFIISGESPIRHFYTSAFREFKGCWFEDISLVKFRDLEERRMRIVQIYVYVLLYFLLKAAAFDVPSYLSDRR